MTADSATKVSYQTVPEDGFCDRDVNTQDSGTYVRCFGSLRTVTPDVLECRDCGTKYIDNGGRHARR